MKRIKALDFDIKKGLINNQSYILSLLFYYVGIFISILMFSRLTTDLFNDILANNIKIEEQSLLELFVNKLVNYTVFYVVTVILGFCVIGFLFTNIAILFIGFNIGINLVYIYNLYNIKGLGYSILLFVPEESLFVLIIIFTIKYSNELSKKCFDAIRGNNKSNEINLFKYIKVYIANLVFVIAISGLNSLLIYSLNSIITI